MATSLSVSIMGEERIVTEALSIALLTRGLHVTLISTLPCEMPHTTFSPAVLILTSNGSYERIRAQLATTRASFPQTKIIVLARSSDKDLPRYVLENVDECLPTVNSFEKLVRTLERLRDLGSPSPMTDVIDSIGRLTTRPTDLDPELTIREQEVFRSISAGLSNKEIAKVFSISTSTVKNHVHNILVKLNIRRRHYALGRTYMPRIPKGAPPWLHHQVGKPISVTAKR